MPDLHGWITQQIDRVENNLRTVDKEHGPTWTTQWDARTDTFTIYDDNRSAVAADVLPAASALIALNDPTAVLRHCAADRKILERHQLDPDAIWYEAAMCKGCGTYGDMETPETENLNDCPELLDLAEGYGLTPELLATLDRPKEGDRPEPRAFRIGPPARPTSSVPPALRGPNWKAQP